MIELLIDESLAQIETALLREFTFALCKNTLPPAADPAALRLHPALENGSPTRTDLDLVFVSSIGKRFYWLQTATDVDDGLTVIKPFDAGVSGRWLVVDSTLTFNGVPLAQLADGILDEVILYNGDFDFKELKNRIYGKAPCVAIHFDEEEHSDRSQIPGALYDYRVRFEIWSVSRNYRDRFEAAVGSPIAAEAADDPGMLKIHGAVKRLLTENASTGFGLMGSSTNYSGIASLTISKGRVDTSDLAERVFVMALDMEMRGSIANPDNPSEIVELEGINMQRMQSQTGSGAELDVANAVLTGLGVPLGVGFAKTIEAGTANIAGELVAASPYMRTFTASTYTYRDLNPDGSWGFVEAAQNQEPDDPAPGALRVGVTVTDSTGVSDDSFIASVYTASEDSDEIDL